MPESNTTDSIVSAYLAEYNALRAEVLARFQTQNQAFNFLLLVLGASITAVVTTANDGEPERLNAVILSVALLLPLITCPLAYIFFDNEVMIHAIGSYIYYDRRKSLGSIIGHPYFFGNLTDFQYLPPSTHSIFHYISRGRWILFCIPSFIPLVFTPLYLYTKWDDLPRYSTIIVASAILAFLLDLTACCILAGAIKWIFDNTKYQIHLAEAEKKRVKPASP